MSVVVRSPMPLLKATTAATITTTTTPPRKPRRKPRGSPDNTIAALPDSASSASPTPATDLVMVTPSKPSKTTASSTAAANTRDAPPAPSDALRQRATRPAASGKVRHIRVAK